MTQENPTRKQKPVQTSPPSSYSPSQDERKGDGGRERRSMKERPSSLQTRFEEKRKEIDSNHAHSMKKEGRFSRNSKIQRPSLNKTREQRSSSMSIDFKNEDEIVKGFIFSEIMGPPRSKKLHHRK